MIKYFTKVKRGMVSDIKDIPFSKLHRVNGPAIEGPNGLREWWINGELLKTNNKPIEWFDGRKRRRVEKKNTNTKEISIWIKENNINLNKKVHQVLFKLRF